MAFAADAIALPYADGVAYVVGRVVLGPFFGFSDAWQLSMNTTGSIVVLLMVFLIQNTQVRHTEAIQAKLDALLHAIENADRRKFLWRR